MSASAVLRRFATPFFQHPLCRAVALRFAAHRGRSLVLLYHRVLPDGIAPGAIVPAVSVTLFREQVEALLQLGDIVALKDLLVAAPPTSRPRFALTFDDDHAGYVRTVLPTLQALGVTATFFLSGRTLRGLAPYWWANVEGSLRTRGIEFTRETLGVRGSTATEIAIELEQSGRGDQLAQRLPAVAEPTMPAEDIRTLARAGMTIGFHTLHHPVLTMQSPGDLEAALTEGRGELAGAAGAGVDFLAYPYGKANETVAEAAERAHFTAAFATGGRPITAESDRYLLGRWEPGPLSANELGAHVAARLLRPPTSPSPPRSPEKATRT